MTTDDVRDELEKIRESGPLTASRVLAAASRARHPLHGKFEWDDAVAAHQHRLSQARQLIANVTIEPVVGQVLTAYFHVPNNLGEGEYVPIDALVRHPDKLALARAAVVASIRSAQDNLTELETAQAVFGKPARKNVSKARRALETAQKEVLSMTQ